MGTDAMAEFERDDLAQTPIERADLSAIEAARASNKVQSDQLRQANSQLVLATLRAQTAEAALREVAQHKDEFIAMVGHELRNPLAPIRTGLEILKKDKSNGPASTRDRAGEPLAGSDPGDRGAGAGRARLIVAILPDLGERYLSTALYPD